jgi:hypothetical protein
MRPRDFARQIARVPDVDPLIRQLARHLAHQLSHADVRRFERRGLAHLPDELVELWGEPQMRAALDVLISVGYGSPQGTKPRRAVHHGIRLGRRLDRIQMQLPRAIALRYPTTANTHASGPVQGTDVWGTVTVNHTARDKHLALIGIALGLWKAYGKSGTRYIDVTRGELAYLLWAAGREKKQNGGEDLVTVDEALRDLDREQITATVDRRGGNDPSEQHVIPNAPIVAVEAQLDGRWVSLEDFQQLCGGRATGRCGQHETVRIHLAAWAIEAITERRAVFCTLGIWRGLTGTGRRLYAYLQGSPTKNGRIFFYLADPLRFTLGLSGRRPHEADAAVRHQLTCLYDRDQRYTGFGESPRPGVDRPVFGVHVSGQSQPRAGMADLPPMARRPSCVRKGWGVGRVSEFHIRPQDIPEGLRKLLGFEEARRRVAHVRYLAARSRTAGDTMAAKAALARQRRSIGDDVDRDLSVIDELDAANPQRPAAPPPDRRGP